MGVRPRPIGLWFQVKREENYLKVVPFPPKVLKMVQLIQYLHFLIKIKIINESDSDSDIESERESENES